MHPVHFVEIASLGVLAAFSLLEWKTGAWRETLALAFALVVSSWLAEDTCIRLYEFYAYKPEWHVFLDQMPLMVALIWPFVVLSDLRVVRGALGQDHRWMPVWTGILVFWDACLMETVAAKAGLWTWFQPGLFDVPLIGLLGWGYFTAAALFFWQRLKGRARWAMLLLAPLATHALLLATWWGGLRWVLRGPYPDEAVVVAGALGSLMLAVVVWKAKVKVPFLVMGPRILAAGVFFYLLWAYGRDDTWLVAFIATFVPPYLLATEWPWEGRGLPTQT